MAVVGLVRIEARRKLAGRFGCGVWCIENDKFGFKADGALDSSIGKSDDSSELYFGVTFYGNDLVFGVRSGFDHDFFLIFFIGDGDEVSAFDGSDAGEVKIFEGISDGDVPSDNGFCGEGAVCPEFAVELKRFLFRDICMRERADDETEEGDENG